MTLAETYTAKNREGQTWLVCPGHFDILLTDHLPDGTKVRGDEIEVKWQYENPLTDAWTDSISNSKHINVDTRQVATFKQMRDVVYATFGGGINTIAGIIKATKMGIKFDVIVMADPGKENPLTYSYIDYFNVWLVEHNQPTVTIVKQKNFKGEFIGLYQNCINEGMLPSIAYGHKSCSMKYKKAPQDVFCNNNAIIREAWKNGYKVIKYMWYDFDEDHRTTKDYSDDRYQYKYLLVDNEIDRFGCIQIIIDEGLVLPPKSSCTFCPSMKPYEIIELYETNPKEFYDAIRMEDNAKGNLLTIKGLGRDFSWWELILAYKYFRLVKRYNSMTPIPKRILKMVKKINRSVNGTKKAKTKVTVSKKKTAKEITCDMFKTRIDAPCDCMN